MKTRVEHLSEDVTLYLGDARTIVPGLRPVDFIFTDPPYGNKNNDGDLIHNIERAIPARRKNGDFGSAVYESRPIANDGAKEANDLINWFFAQTPKLLSAGCCLCCCCAGGGGENPTVANWLLALDKHLKCKQLVVWDKGPMGMGWHYRRSYEFVLVGEKPGAACRWFDQTDKIENIIRPGAFGVRKIIPQAEDHPTPKPWELSAHFIRLHSLSGHTVLDPFMGGGSTGVAAVKLGRKFIGIDVESKWFDLACRRIEKEIRSPGVFEVAARLVAKKSSYLLEKPRKAK